MKIDKTEILSLQQYADLKKVSLKTVYNWLNTGYLTPTIIGKTKFITITKK
jgi:predicted site-specific integrase-resolvase